MSYAYPWSGLLARFKFSGEPGWAQALGERIARIPGIAQELQRADLVLPMPLAGSRSNLDSPSDTACTRT